MRPRPESARWFKIARWQYRAKAGGGTQDCADMTHCYHHDDWRANDPRVTRVGGFALRQRTENLFTVHSPHNIEPEPLEVCTKHGGCDTWPNEGGWLNFLHAWTVGRAATPQLVVRRAVECGHPPWVPENTRPPSVEIPVDHSGPQFTRVAGWVGEGAGCCETEIRRLGNEPFGCSPPRCNGPEALPLRT